MVLPEAARIAHQMGFLLDGGATLETELWLLGKQIELENRLGPWVSDRCLIDLFAYIVHLFKDDKSLIDLALRVLKKQIISYDLIVYLPNGEFSIENDGLRTMDEHFQSEIDKIIVNVMVNHDVKFQTIIGTPEGRLKQVSKFIDIWKPQK